MIAYRNLRYWLCITVLLLVLFPIQLRSNAQEGVFSETFDDPTLPGWEYSPEAQVVNGVLRIQPDNFAFHGGQWREVNITLRARLIGEGELVIGYSMTDQGVYQVVLSAHSASLLRQMSDTVEALMGTPSGAPLDEWFDLEISIANGEHFITLNGQLLLTGHDLDPLAPGGILLQARGGAVGEFDDLVVIAPHNQTVPEAGLSPQTANVPAYQAGSWVRTGGPIGGLGYDIRYNFADYNIWYVTDVWSGFYISTDNGTTWTPSNTGITARKGTDGIPIFSATVDPHNPNIIWIGTDLTGDIYKSTDGGHTWVEMTNGVDPNLRPMSFRGFTVDPRTSDIVYAMAEIGSPAWTPDRNPRKGLEQDLTQGVVYKTTDGGEHWTEIWRGDNLARYAWIDPRNPDVLYVSTGIFDREAANTDVATGFAGGVDILKSTDGGQTWRVLNQDNGLLDLYIGSLYMSPQNPDVLLAAAGQNNWSRYGEQFTGGIYLTKDGGEHWERVITDNEIFSTVEYCVSDPNVAYAGSSRCIYRSDDGGHTWQRFTRADHTWGSPGVVAGFPIDMQCDPVDPMQIFINNYLGGNFLSTDGGATWVLSSDGYTGELVNVVVATPGPVYVGSRSGVFRSDNGGEDWIGLVYPPEGMQTKFNEVVALAIDPADFSHLLAVPADFGGVMHSTDGGQSWQMGSAFGPNQAGFRSKRSFYRLCDSQFRPFCLPRRGHNLDPCAERAGQRFYSACRGPSNPVMPIPFTSQDQTRAF